MPDKDSNIIPLPNADEIEIEATEWLVVLGRDDVTLEDLSLFNKWLEQSDRHRAVFDEISAFSDEMECLKGLHDIAESLTEDELPKPGRNRKYLYGIAASILVAVMASTTLYYSYVKSLTQHALYSTAVGEQRTEVLKDGSVIQLNTDSSAEIEMERDQRIVRLIKGEAHFDVAKDADRPFRVYAKGEIVQAIGTAFAIRLRSDNSVEVIVEEGRIALASSVPSLEMDKGALQKKDGSPATELTAGQSALISEKLEVLSEISTPEVNRKLAWRHGMLAYSGEPLWQVIEDVKRYTDINIEVTDPALKNIPVSGYFRVGEVETLLTSFELNFDITVDRSINGLIRLNPST